MTVDSGRCAEMLLKIDDWPLDTDAVGYILHSREFCILDFMTCADVIMTVK